MPRTVIDNISSRDREIYNYIKSYFDEHGYAPTVREIVAGTSMKSPSSVQMHLERLFRLGYLESEAPAGSPRAFRLGRKECGDG